MNSDQAPEADLAKPSNPDQFDDRIGSSDHDENGVGVAPRGAR